MLHWIYCNIYTQSYKTVKKKIEELYKEHKAMKDYIKKGEVKPIRIDLINLSKSRTDLFDIKGSPEQIKNKQNYGELK